MSDITASERRLSAALDRLDKLLEAGAAAPTPIAEGEAAETGAETSVDHAALTDLQARMEAATEQAAAMSAANEDLIAANRDLLEAQATGGIGPDESRAALEAEIAALRAARAAEMAQMSEIMAELERLLAGDPATEADGAPLSVHAANEAPVGIDTAPDMPLPAEAAGDDAGLPEAPTPAEEER